MSDIEETMESHPHGTRFVDDDGRCLACALFVAEQEHEQAAAEIARLREDKADLERKLGVVRDDLTTLGGSLARAKQFIYKERDAWVQDNSTEADDETVEADAMPRLLQIDAVLEDIRRAQSSLRPIHTDAAGILKGGE